MPAAFAAPLLIGLLFALAWLNYPSINPLASYAATIVFGFAYSSIFVSMNQYIIDAYETSSSSAMASITFARYLFSTGMIGATKPMYEALGVHWACTFLAILTLLMLPVPFWLIARGARFRNNSGIERSSHARKTSSSGVKVNDREASEQQCKLPRLDLIMTDCQ